MKPGLLAKLRLASQCVPSAANSPTSLVRHMGALQAQDYTSALWAIGARVKGATEKSVEEAISRREIVRTWPMRRTLHFVPGEDAKWLTQLSAERVIASAAGRAKDLELDDKVFAKVRKVAIKALEGGNRLTRDELRQRFIEAKLPAQDSRASHLFWRLAQESLLCFGTREGKQPTFVLLDEWVTNSLQPDREEGIRTLALRYFRSHGPATLKDFTWWSGLKVSEARVGIEAAGSELEKISIEGIDCWLSPELDRKDKPAGMHLLPAFDEIVIAYHDRLVTLATEHSDRIVPGGNGMFLPMVVDEGRVIGTWKRTTTRKEVRIVPELFKPLPKTKIAALKKAGERYAAFLGLAGICEGV